MLEYVRFEAIEVTLAVGSEPPAGSSAGTASAVLYGALVAAFVATLLLAVFTRRVVRRRRLERDVKVSRLQSRQSVSYRPLSRTTHTEPSAFVWPAVHRQPVRA